MSLVQNPQRQPRPEEAQNSRIVPGSPLAIIGLFVEIIRKRFTADAGLPWTWNPDVKATQILIESAFNENTEARNKRPAIYVDKEASTIGRTVLGDRVGVRLKTQLDGQWGLQTVPITVECVSSKRGESAILGDLIQLYIHASSDLIQAKFGLHELTPVTLEKTTPFSRDKDSWVSAVTFTIQYPVRWTLEPTQVILQEIEHEIINSGDETATEFFERLAVSPAEPPAP